VRRIPNGVRRGEGFCAAAAWGVLAFGVWRGVGAVLDGDERLCYGETRGGEVVPISGRGVPRRLVPCTEPGRVWRGVGAVLDGDERLCYGEARGGKVVLLPAGAMPTRSLSVYGTRARFARGAWAVLDGDKRLCYGEGRGRGSWAVALLAGRSGRARRRRAPMLRGGAWPWELGGRSFTRPERPTSAKLPGRRPARRAPGC
jgi:hypothetical protein